MAHRTPLLTGDVITETVANDWLQRLGDHLTGPLEADGRDITGVGALAAAILTLKGDAHGAGHVLDGNAFDQTALPSAYPDGITAFSDSSGLWPGSSAAHVLTIESPLFECVMQLKGSRTDAVLCFWHDPESRQQAAEARRLGGHRRRREAVVATAFGLDGLESVRQIRRLIEVAVSDTLSLENSVSRNRTLAYLVQTALKALESGEFEERLAAVEARIAEADRKGAA